MPKYSIEVSGDIAGVVTMPKQIVFGASRAINDTLTRTQAAIIKELPEDFEIRDAWWTPGRKYGINVRFASASRLEGSVGTNADWLLEAEGYHGGIKRPDRGGGNLAEPNVEHTRHGIRNKIARGEKARRLLDNASRTKAFKVKGKYGNDLILQRVGLDAQGDALRGKRGNYLAGRGKKKVTKVVLKYAMRKSVRVPYHPVVTRTGRIQFLLHFGSYLRQNLAKAMNTAKYK